MDHAPRIIAPLVIVGLLLGLFFAVLLFVHHVLHLGWGARLTNQLSPHVSATSLRILDRRSSWPVWVAIWPC